KQIVAEVALDAEAKETARQLNGGNRAFLEFRELVTRANTEEGELFAFCVGDQLAGGESNAIDFVKGFAEQRDAGRSGHSPLSSPAKNTSRRAGRICGLARNAMMKRKRLMKF